MNQVSSMKLVSFRLVLLVALMIDLSASFYPAAYPRPLKQHRVLQMELWNNAKLAKIAYDDNMETFRLALERTKANHADTSQKASRDVEQMKVDLELMKIAHSYMNHKASMDLELMKIEHSYMNFKALTKLAYISLIVFSCLSAFYIRNRARNTDKILVVAKLFQLSLDKLVFAAQTFGVVSALEFFHPPITWLLLKIGITL